MDLVKNLRLVEFDLSSACTRECSFCSPGIPKHRRENPVYLSQAIIFATCMELALNDFKGCVVLCGHGEPTMHPDLIKISIEIKRILPHNSLMLFTNGDLLTVNLLNDLDVDKIIFDCYDFPTGEKVKEIVLKSNKVDKVFCIDHARGVRHFNSRAGSIRPTECVNRQCDLMTKKAFLSAEGDWITCCNDYKQTNKWRGTLKNMFTDQKHIFMRNHLMLPNRKVLDPCKYCEAGSTGKNHCIMDEPSILECDWSEK